MIHSHFLTFVALKSGLDPCDQGTARIRNWYTGRYSDAEPLTHRVASQLRSYIVGVH